MAAVAITIRGTLYDLQNKSARQVVLIGESHLTGLEVGGGPIIPPDTPPDLGFWGGANVPMPSPPIANVPGSDNPNAPGFGLKPTHPIALPGDPWWPKPPTEPPPDSGMVKPPPPEGGWGWSPEYGWGYFPKPGEPGPKT